MAPSVGYPNVRTCNDLALTNFRMGHLNASARGLTDRVAVLDTRGDGPLASRLQWLNHNFSGIRGDSTLNLHGLDIREDSEHVLHILLVNHRPPFDPITGQPLDAAKVGANSTIELFETAEGSETMRHVKTFAHDSIQTPNDVAWVSEESFVFTNDHSSKVGLVSVAFPFGAHQKLTDPSDENWI